MIAVLIYKESRFPTDRSKLRKFIEDYLSSKIRGNTEVSISIVGDRKMKSLNAQYRKIATTTDVLSFPLDDATISNKDEIKSGFSPEKSAPDKILRLGDVIVSYPQAVQEAAEDNKMVDQKLQELIAHGLNHLLGIHHP